jgi:hypothetical protein
MNTALAHPTGEPIPVLVTPFDVDDSTPRVGEIEDAVIRLKTGKAPGPSGIKSKQLNEWMAAAMRVRIQTDTGGTNSFN